jgi:hypothetical protein
MIPRGMTFEAAWTPFLTMFFGRLPHLLELLLETSEEQLLRVQGIDEGFELGEATCERRVELVVGDRLDRSLRELPLELGQELVSTVGERLRPSLGVGRVDDGDPGLALERDGRAHVAAGGLVGEGLERLHELLVLEFGEQRLAELLLGIVRAQGEGLGERRGDFAGRRLVEGRGPHPHVQLLRCEGAVEGRLGRRVETPWTDVGGALERLGAAAHGAPPLEADRRRCRR